MNYLPLMKIMELSEEAQSIIHDNFNYIKYQTDVYGCYRMDANIEINIGNAIKKLKELRNELRQLIIEENSVKENSNEQ